MRSILHHAAVVTLAGAFLYPCVPSAHSRAAGSCTGRRSPSSLVLSRWLANAEQARRVQTTRRASIRIPVGVRQWTLARGRGLRLSHIEQPFVHGPRRAVVARHLP